MPTSARYCILVVLFLFAASTLGCSHGGLPSASASHSPQATLAPYIGPKSERLASVARRWLRQWQDPSVQTVTVVSTTLQRASGIFGSVIQGQGARKSVALFATGAFTSPISRVRCRFIAEEVDAQTLVTLIQTWGLQGWEVTPLGVAHSLKVR